MAIAGITRPDQSGIMVLWLVFVMAAGSTSSTTRFWIPLAGAAVDDSVVWLECPEHGGEVSTGARRTSR
jgi:hypothetical protein